MTSERMRLVLEPLSTPVGEMLVLCDRDGRLRALDWHGFEERMHKLLRLHYGHAAVEIVEGSVADDVRRALREYLAGELNALSRIEVACAGTAFQRSVWQALRRIPVGTVTSYRELALALGNPRAVRAVGMANASNPIGVVVPCHRVIGTSGQLTGYAGGLARKRWLLEHEGVRLGERTATASGTQRAVA